MSSGMGKLDIDKHLNAMIRNLHYGEESLRLLKESLPKKCDPPEKRVETHKEKERTKEKPQY